MNERDRFVSELRKEAKLRGLVFATNRTRGKGGHITVSCGDRLTTLPTREVDPVTAAMIRTRLGLA